MSGVIKYRSNNSGGSWWLDDKDWQALEDAGWVVHWYHDADDPSHTHDEDEHGGFGNHSHAYSHPLLRSTSNGHRWLGALATSAAKETDDPQAAVDEWARVTKNDPSDEGCNCCGEPHNFTFTDAEGNRRYSSVEVTQTRTVWS